MRSITASVGDSTYSSSSEDRKNTQVNLPSVHEKCVDDSADEDAKSYNPEARHHMSAHERKALQDADLRRDLNALRAEKRQCRTTKRWQRRLAELDLPNSGAWLHHHPQDITEQTRRLAHHHFNPWPKPDAESKIEWNVNIWDDQPQSHEVERSISPCGAREREAEVAPLPHGIRNWEELQGCSTKMSPKQRFVQSIKCAASRLAWTKCGKRIRAVVGAVIDTYNLPWPNKYRFSKCEDTWDILALTMDGKTKTWC